MIGDPFERWLAKIQDKSFIYYSFVTVADTAKGCLLWFKNQGIEPSAEAIVNMTALVLKEADLAMAEAKEEPNS